MKLSVNSKEYKSAISVEKMRKSDEYTIKNFISSKELMYRAAKGIFDNAEWKNKKIAIVCVSGNNGGDGYALAEILADNGIFPRIFRLSEKFSEDGEYYFKKAIEKGVKSFEYTDGKSFSEYDIIVDCIFGTGFKGKPEGISKEAIESINNSGVYVISADINSGLNGDTGEAELSVKSDLTVSIGYYKTGMFKGVAPDAIGKLVNVDIGIVLTD